MFNFLYNVNDTAYNRVQFQCFVFVPERPLFRNYICNFAYGVQPRTTR